MLEEAKNRGSLKQIGEYVKEDLLKYIKSKPVVLDTYKMGEMYIRQVRVAYKNGALIELLSKRGWNMGTADFEEITEIDEDIKYLIEHNRVRLTTPIYLFVTFNRQEAVARCEKYLMGKKRDESCLILQENKFEIEKAPEPSDVIWENLEVSRGMMKTRTFFVGLAILIFLLFTLVLFTLLKTEAGKN